MVSLSSVLVVCCFSLCLVDAFTPKPVMEMLQQQIASSHKRANADCSTCNKPDQWCDYRSWNGFCKECPVCGIDHFCDGHGDCTRCPGIYNRPDMSCERVDKTDPKSEGTYITGKAVKLAFATVGDDLYYLSATPNYTLPETPAPTGNVSAPTGNSTSSLADERESISAVLSATPSSHVIEEVTPMSGQYRLAFNDSLGGYVRMVVPSADELKAIDAQGDVASLLQTATSENLKTLGLAQVYREFNSASATVFSVEHSASFSWRFKVGVDDTARYLAWCGQATCGNGVPALRLVPGMFCGSLTSSGIRCDVMIIN